MKKGLVFLGPPASGKGTQAQRLAEELEIACLSTGALLRSALSVGSPLGEKAKPYLDRGEYVPDEIRVPIVIEWVSNQSEGWLLDGFPRTVHQAEALDRALESNQPQAIVLHVPDDELRKRVIRRLECESCHRVSRSGDDEFCPDCGGLLNTRDDDSPEKFESRLSEFHRLVFPTIQYYCDRGRARIVNGVGSLDDVWRRVRV